MKKFAAHVALLIGLGVFAGQAQTATLLLQGTVGVNCVLNSVDTTPYGNANTTLPIVAGTPSTTVADASVTCNNAPGYTITATSANGLSRLQNNFDPANYYTQYELEIGGTGSTGFNPVATDTLLKSTTLSAPVDNELSAINVKVLPIATPAASGTYQDTVTLTLTAL